MFSRHDEKAFIDLSAELNDESDWQAGVLRRLNYYLDISSIAYEPVSGLLAIGTTNGLIHLYGSPGVEVLLHVSNHARVKLLQFSSSTLRLLCVDDIERLHVWDLTAPSKPRLQKIANSRHPVNAISLSPSHTHAFIALSNGEIKPYDLLCSWYSPYTVINLWAQYEEKMAASGMPSFTEPGSHVPVDLVIHPRDLNLLFIAYGGGVVLCNLTQRSIIRVFELVLSPGAPGGSGYGSPDLMTHRRPSVTTIAVHPAGHYFVVGYADGSIAFWALEDDDKPLIVRTLDDIDVNVVDGDRLNEVMSASEKPKPEDREPIFKLAWSGYPNSSDPRGGETTLTVLGGLRDDESPGVTVVLFPAFNPTDIPNSSDTQMSLPPQVRTAMKKSLEPKDAYIYYTKGIPQDFLLLPKDNPHFSGTFDPTAIILLYDYQGGTRATEAHQFPPPSFISSSSEHKTEEIAESEQFAREDATNDNDDTAGQELASTLLSMNLNDDPKLLQLPPSLWNGPNGVLGGHLYALDKEAYETLLDPRDLVDGDTLPLRGGIAWVEDTYGEMKLMKVQPVRILVTHHRNLSIRFQDLTARLLVSSDTSPLSTSFPNPIPQLTLDLTTLLAEPAVATRLHPRFLDEARIQSVQFATEALECGVAFETGEVAVYRLLHHGDALSGIHVTAEDQELIPLQHIPAQPGRRFCPLFMLMAGRGPVSTLALSDIGFLAVSYADGSLFVIDMRGPSVILRYLAGSKEKRHSILSRREEDPVVSLTWAVAGTANDHTPRILLLAVHSSGTAIIYTVLRSSTGAWTIKDNPEKTEAYSHPIPGASFVIDARGSPCKANRYGLATALNPSLDPSEIKRNIWITAGVKGVKCVADVNGDRVGKAEWGSKVGKVERVDVVQKSAATVLVAYTDLRQAVVYSLPFLEHLHTLQMEQTSLEPVLTDGTGDYIECVRHDPSGLIASVHYGTLFDVRRSGPYAAPDVILADEDRSIPPQPQPVSIGPASLLSSWFGSVTNQTLTGEQIDALLAGPDRPVPQHFERLKPHAQEPSGTGTAANYAASANARDIAASASSAASDLYNRLGNAIAERGEMLGQLQESFDSLEEGSRKMLAQTKGLATQQTAKRWFGF